MPINRVGLSSKTAPLLSAFGEAMRHLTAASLIGLIALVSCQEPTPPSAPATRSVAPASPAAPPPVATGPALTAGTFAVDPDQGNNSFAAVFDASLGERINAISSAVDCQVSYDDKAFTISGRCGVPLTTIMVDNEPKKAEHFWDWATNKKSEPKNCRIEATFPLVKFDAPLTPGIPAKFSARAAFTVCGRSRVGGGPEQVEGTVLVLPAEEGGRTTLRVRAEVAHFSRDQYHISPAYTDGWVARVQQLAKVVADEGTISLSLFAKAPAATPAMAPTPK
jgi:hypothetical protein